MGGAGYRRHAILTITHTKGSTSTMVSNYNTSRPPHWPSGALRASVGEVPTQPQTASGEALPRLTFFETSFTDYGRTPISSKVEVWPTQHVPGVGTNSNKTPDQGERGNSADLTAAMKLTRALNVASSFVITLGKNTAQTLAGSRACPSGTGPTQKPSRVVGGWAVPCGENNSGYPTPTRGRT